MTEQNKTPLTVQPGSVPPPEHKPAEKPLRRVGSLTLGACLIAAGVFFLLYFFVPGFDVQLTLKIAPAVALVLLGCEVLFFAARPGRWKYDFVSVLVCLVLMAGCFCMAMLPVMFDELTPEKQQVMNRLSAQAIDELYTACKQDAQDIAIRDISGRMFLSGPQVETLQQAAALPADQRLMNQNFRVGQCKTLSLGAACQQEGTHGSCHAHADGGNIALDILHGIVDGHAGADRAAGAVDIQADVLIRVLPFQIQQLCHNKAGGGIVDILAQNDDAIVQKTGENIIGTLAMGRLFHNVRNKTHKVRLLKWNIVFAKLTDTVSLPVLPYRSIFTTFD